MTRTSMETNEPTNQELMHFIKDMGRKIADIKEKDLPEINVRVKTTNGSVADIVRWKERWTGAGYVILIVVLPIMSWALYRLSTLDSTINTAVSQSFRSNVESVIQK